MFTNDLRYVSGGAQAISSGMPPAAVHMHGIQIVSLSHESLEGSSFQSASPSSFSRMWSNGEGKSASIMDWHRQKSRRTTKKRLSTCLWKFDGNRESQMAKKQLAICIVRIVGRSYVELCM